MASTHKNARLPAIRLIRLDGFQDTQTRGEIESRSRFWVIRNGAAAVDGREIGHAKPQARIRCLFLLVTLNVPAVVAIVKAIEYSP